MDKCIAFSIQLLNQLPDELGGRIVQTHCKDIKTRSSINVGQNVTRGRENEVLVWMRRWTVAIVYKLMRQSWAGYELF